MNMTTITKCYKWARLASDGTLDFKRPEPYSTEENCYVFLKESYPTESDAYLDMQQFADKLEYIAESFALITVYDVRNYK